MEETLTQTGNTAVKKRPMGDRIKDFMNLASVALKDSEHACNPNPIFPGLWRKEIQGKRN